MAQVDRAVGGREAAEAYLQPRCSLDDRADGGNGDGGGQRDRITIGARADGGKGDAGQPMRQRQLERMTVLTRPLFIERLQPMECCVPRDYIPLRSYALFEARSILREVFGCDVQGKTA